jgi:hypothetical protein
MLNRVLAVFFKPASYNWFIFERKPLKWAQQGLWRDAGTSIVHG